MRQFVIRITTKYYVGYMSMHGISQFEEATRFISIPDVKRYADAINQGIGYRAEIVEIEA